MNKKEIQQEIESVRLKLQTLEKKLANGNNFSDEQARTDIAEAVRTYRDELMQSGGWSDIGSAFGEVVEVGEYKHRGLFLTPYYNKRDWEWQVYVDTSTNLEVLVRVDKKTMHIID